MKTPCYMYVGLMRAFCACGSYLHLSKHSFSISSACVPSLAELLLIHSLCTSISLTHTHTRTLYVSHTQDYPSMGQVVSLLKKYDVIPIFAILPRVKVTPLDNFLPTYEVCTCRSLLLHIVFITIAHKKPSTVKSDIL